MLANELTKTLLLLMTVFAVVAPVVVVSIVTVEVPSLDVVLAMAVTSFSCKKEIDYK